jgi:hypothetical protein
MSDSGRRDDSVKHLTLENWSQPDDTGRAFGAIHSATGERRDASVGALPARDGEGSRLPRATTSGRHCTVLALAF